MAVNPGDIRERMPVVSFDRVHLGVVDFVRLPATGAEEPLRAVARASAPRWSPTTVPPWMRPVTLARPRSARRRRSIAVTPQTSASPRGGAPCPPTRARNRAPTPTPAALTLHCAATAWHTAPDIDAGGRWRGGEPSCCGNRDDAAAEPAPTWRPYRAAPAGAPMMTPTPATSWCRTPARSAVTAQALRVPFGAVLELDGDRIVLDCMADDCRLRR
ncbi:MAG: hypothetical protein U0531_06290 [Dehalococcoidia bacterium]